VLPVALRAQRPFRDRLVLSHARLARRIPLASIVRATARRRSFCP
jgi:hypothetical protein